MTYDLVIKGGQLVTASETYVADLAIRGERIAAIGAELHGRREIDAAGLYLLPGAIDGHVHLTDPTYPPYAIPTADSFAVASRAAAFGGVTTLIDFAQPTPARCGPPGRPVAGAGRWRAGYCLHRPQPTPPHRRSPPGRNRQH